MRKIRGKISIALVAALCLIVTKGIFGQNTGWCIHGNCNDGEGESSYSDASVYRGSFAGGMRHGEGSMIYPDGSFFHGMWENDKKNGQGVSLFSDGSEFRGVFKENDPDGEGIFIASDGSMKKVIFRQGKLISFSPIDFEKIDGTLRYGTVLALGGVYTGWYSGKRAEGYIPQRRGRIRWEDGSAYAGQWADGKMHGRGVMKWPDGSSYVGQWVAGRRTGSGTYTWKSGSKYMGEWKDNRKHGKGIAVYADGTIQQGIFFEDTFRGTQ